MTKDQNLTVNFALRSWLGAPTVACTTGSFTIHDDVVVSSSNCTGNAIIPSGIRGIGDGAFDSATGLTSITIPDSVTSIGMSAFSGASNLTSLTIPSGVTSIGAYAFYRAGLTSITIPNGITNIYPGAFGGMESLTSITIPSSVTSIDWGAFSNATSLTSVTFAGKSSLTSIGTNAFSGAKSLTNITLPNGLTSIGNAAFHNAALTSITIPNSVTSIGNYAFLGSGLTSVNLSTSSNLESIGNGAFYGAGLTSINIPNSVTSIGDYAFYAASKLASVRFLGNAPTVGAYAFDGVSASVYRFANATGFGADFTTTFHGFLQSPLVLPPVNLLATGGDASATISITTPPTLGPAPSSYTVSAVTDATKTCVITGSTGSCTINGLTNGMPHTFTAITHTTTPAADSIESDVSNEVTPNISTQPGLLPPATPLAVAGNASATIRITNPPSLGPAPTSYTIRVANDATKTCTITGSTGSCTINGLTNGTPYTFTAIAHTTTPVATSIASDASNQVTPTASTPSDAPSNIQWNTNSPTTKQLITSTFEAAPNTTYTINSDGTARKTCSLAVNKITKKRIATCTINIKKTGTWIVKITPTKYGYTGTPATKTFNITT
jgi:hypothetical protein